MLSALRRRLRRERPVEVPPGFEGVSVLPMSLAPAEGLPEPGGLPPSENRAC